MAPGVHDLIYKQVTLQILRLKATATNGEWEKAGDSRAYIYASRGEGEGARERTYMPPALKVLTILPNFYSMQKCTKTRGGYA